LLKFDSNNALVGRIDYLDAEQQYVLGDRDLGEGDQTETNTIRKLSEKVDFCVTEVSYNDLSVNWTSLAFQASSVATTVVA